MKKIIALFAVLVSASVTTAAALPYEITSVLNKTEHGFGSTLFHEATGPGGMSGSILDEATGEASGFWNDETGEFSMTMQLKSGGTAEGVGVLNFDGIGDGLVGRIDFEFIESVAALEGVHTMLFRQMTYSAAAGVNGFDGSVISLWGAAGGVFQDPGKGFDNADFGADFRISVASVPLPPAILGFLTALAGFAWLGRRKTNA